MKAGLSEKNLNGPQHIVLTRNIPNRKSNSKSIRIISISKLLPVYAVSVCRNAAKISIVGNF